jgi:hypothetical protein
MARETQAQRLQKYRDCIDSSRRWRENKGYVELWKRMIDLYRGKQVEGLNDKAMINMAFAVHNIVVASVTTQFPKFTVSPNVIGQDDQATVAEAVLNYAWRHYNFHDEFQAAVNDMCMIGHGWMKVGWRYKEHTERVTLSAEEQYTQVAEDMAAAEAAVTTAPGVPAPSNEAIEEAVQPTQEVPVVDEDDPFAEHVSVFDVVVDPEATKDREITWIAQRYVRDLKDVRDDEAYDTTARHKVQADMSVSSDHDSYKDGNVDEPTDVEDEDRCTIWEYYGVKENFWCIFAEEGEGFLVKPAPIPTPFPNPFVMFRDYDVPDTFYPMGEIESIETLQEELNKTRTQQIEARKQFIRKFLGREAALNERARQALMSAIDGDVALVSDDDRPLSDIIIQAPSLSFDPNLFNQHSQQVQQDLQTVTGLSDYQFGQMPDTRRLATEAMAVEGATNARSSYKLSRVERTLAQVGRHLLAVMQVFMDGPRVARVTGPGGEMLFDYGPEDIEGEFDLVVEAGSTQPKNDMIRRQEAITLFNTLAPYMGTLINPQELIRYLLQQGYDIKNVERFMSVPPPPVPGAMPPGMEGAPPGMLPAAPAGAPAPNGETAPAPAPVPV